MNAEELFRSLAGAVALALETVAILVIFVGACGALWELIGWTARGLATQARRRRSWQDLARWLALGLEFTLAADVVRTAIAPSWDQIGLLAAIAFIRTFLNYFLERDLKEAGEYQAENPIKEGG